MTSVSTIVRPMNAGHCHAPRSRHRRRRHQSDSTRTREAYPPGPVPLLPIQDHPAFATETPGRRARRRRSRRRSERKGWQRQMATETAGAPPDVAQHLTVEDRVGLLRAMLTMRGIEERAMTLYRQGKVPGSFYHGYGQEAVSAGPAWAMAAEDRLCVLHRDLAAHVIRGVTPARIFAQYM